jgi:xanthine dehydrogenase accessory factor
MRDFWARVARETEAGNALASATVVSRSAPVSAHVGDRALVYPDGRMEGFVGGACSREIVRRHALDALRSGRARLVKIRPQADGVQKGDGDVVTAMACASEGAADVYVEPHLPPRTLLVAGATPVAQTLARLALSLDYRVVLVVDGAEARDIDAGGARIVVLADLPAFVSGLSAQAAARCVAIVASQGHYDDAALECILRSQISFVGLLASRKRGAALIAGLRAAGLRAEETARVRTPVGIDIGAKEPGEVAVSILAEIVRNRIETSPEAHAGPAVAVETIEPAARDPVCGMEVEPAGSVHRADVNGTAYHFCSAGCKAAFVREPAAFAVRHP